MNQLIDFHSHHPNSKDSEINILNIDLWKKDYDIPGDSLFSLGIHPWYLDTITFENFKQVLKENSHKDNFFGMGEIGLDRLRGIDLQKQIKTFKECLDLALEEGVSNIIVHNVKAHEEILQIIKNKKYRALNFFMHNYFASLETHKNYQQLNVNFSLGEILDSSVPKHVALIKQIDIEKIFIESDEKENSISRRYKRLAEIKEMEIDQVLKIIYRNFRKYH